MATKLYPYKAECDKAGVLIVSSFEMNNDAKDKLISSVGYWQAQKKYKTKTEDWTIIKEA